MICAKCGGLQVVEPTYGPEAKLDPVQERCLNCGRIDSRLIRLNRKRGPEPCLLLD
jgi:hypothetical protein